MIIYNVGNRVINNYVYKTAAGYIMIDMGYEGGLAGVEKKLNQHQIELSDLNYLFLTHAHDDHAGFLNELLGKVPHLKVMMSAKARPTLKKGQHSFEGGCSGYLAWFFCKAMGLVGTMRALLGILQVQLQCIVFIIQMLKRVLTIIPTQQVKEIFWLNKAGATKEFLGME